MKIPTMKVSAFLKREFEQCLVAFTVTFVPATLQGSITRAAIVGAAAAGLRAAYGRVVKDVGAKDTPSVK